MIYKNKDGTYGYTSPRKGTLDGVDPGGPSSVPSGKTPTAYYHTHGAYDPKYDNENFSPPDIQYAAGYEIDGYVATPGGRFGKTDKHGNISYEDNKISKK